MRPAYLRLSPHQHPPAFDPSAVAPPPPPTPSSFGVSAVLPGRQRSLPPPGNVGVPRGVVGAGAARGSALRGAACLPAARGGRPLGPGPGRLAWLLGALGAALAVLGPIVAIRDQPWQLIAPL